MTTSTPMTDAEVRKVIDEWDDTKESFESFAIRRLGHVQVGTLKRVSASMKAEMRRDERRRP